MKIRSLTTATLEKDTLFWVLDVEVDIALNAIGNYGLYTANLTDTVDNGDGTVTITADVYVDNTTDLTSLRNSIFTAIDEEVSSVIVAYATSLFSISDIPIGPEGGGEVGPPGPAGPPGIQGPPGPVNLAAMFLA